MKRGILVWLFTLLMLCSVTCIIQSKYTFAQSKGDEDRSSVITLDDLNGKLIGVQTGTITGALAEARFPASEVNYFNSATDVLTALNNGKVDAWVVDEPIARFLQLEYPGLMILEDSLAENNLAAIFPKTETGQALCDKYSAFIDKLWADGTMAEIDDVWFGADDSKRTVLSYENLPATNGILRMAADLSQLPFVYMKDNRAVGYDVDVASRFCKEYGYGLEIVPMSFDGILASVQSGKCDFSDSCITITKERAESVLFSSPNYYGGIAVVVLKNGYTKTMGTGQPEYTQFSDLRDKTVSMLTGAPFEELVKSKAPDVSEFTFFNSTPDMLLALQSGKTDAVLTNNAIAALAVNRNHDLAHFPQELKGGEFGLAFSKGDPRRDSWQAALDAISQEAIEAAWEKWTGSNESIKVLPVQDWPGTNGTVRVAACDTLEPMSYVGGDGEPKGFDLEVILMIAKEMDVRVEFTGMEFSAILASVQSGKADIGAGSIIITEERAQAVDFVEYYPAAFVLIVRNGDAAVTEISDGKNKEDGFVSSFEKTFLREDRWKLFVEGVLTTLLITLLAILFGTILGFSVFMLCRNGNPGANLITRCCLWVVQGMPMVVLLMILYYIIFGNVDINGVAVAVIGFSITFGATVFGLLKLGVGAVEKDQYEAARALGYSDHRTFYRIILPQALPHVLPAYQGEIVSLIKATAVVGYIAVQDLTKMGDIVRSRTYEAFFPLIAVTVIYFALEELIRFLVRRFSINLDPKRRKREDILKEVRTND